MPSENRASKTGRRSTALRLREIENILAAGVFTAEIHRPLNRFTTIHFEAAGLASPVKAIGRLLKLSGDWLRSKGVVPAYIWVREAGCGKGDHVHLMWHVPPPLIAGFAKRERGWRKQLGAKPADGAFLSKPIGLSYKHANAGMQYGSHYSEHLGRLMAYLIKGGDAESIEALELVMVQFGGELWGKRYGMSENINRKARATANENR